MTIVTANNQQSGFTLIELMVVIVVAVFAVAVALPNFSSGMTSLHLKSATNEIASALRHTRTQAVSNTREAEFFINVEERFYRVSGRDKVFQLPKDIDFSLFTAETEIVGDIGGNIRFFPDGSSTGGRVTLLTGSRKRLVDVNWLTGQIKIRNADGEE